MDGKVILDFRFWILDWESERDFRFQFLLFTFQFVRRKFFIYPLDQLSPIPDTLTADG